MNKVTTFTEKEMRIINSCFDKELFKEIEEVYPKEISCLLSEEETKEFKKKIYKLSGFARTKRVKERWEEGIPHHPAAKWLARTLNIISEKYGKSAIDFKFGGDGDNGEEICYHLSIIFEDPDLLREFKKALEL